tara:strand:+ start:4454 stop:5905 length:1452 start_codon:yes stop_codon:yes gene_type:complete
MDREDLLKAVQAQGELSRRQSLDMLATIDPNDRQRVFLNATSKETMLTGANQAGKSTALCMKFTYHVTGIYPDWYTGHRFEGPIQGALGGETAQSTRDLLVNRLLGPPEERGGGYLPADSFDPEEDITRLSGGVANQIDYFRVKHYDSSGVFDGYSKVYVFAYSTGWRRLQGYSLDLVAIDEEPDMMVYDELSARTNATGGYVDIAMTPLRGETELYMLFEKSPKNGIKRLINYDISEADHMGKDHRDTLMQKYENNPLAEARLHGRPVRSQGLIYSIPQGEIITPDFIVSEKFHQIIGIDLAHTVGKYAAVRIAKDPMSGICYVVDDFKDENIMLGDFAARLRVMGGHEIPVAWPHDGMRQTNSGTIVSELRGHGINVLNEASYVVDPMTGKKSRAVMNIIEETMGMLQTGMLVFMANGCKSTLEEMRRYRHHRGKVAPNQEDHCIDALHKAVMMLRFCKPTGSHMVRGTRVRIVDEDFFGG